jgi:hypothetical protein
VIRFLIAILLLPWVVGFALQLPSLAKDIFVRPVPLFPFALGLGSYALVWFFMIRKKRDTGVWDTFEHELTHAIFCVLLFKKVHAFHAGAEADQDGRLGYISHEGATGFRETLITLAPYFFPTYTVFLFLIRLLVAESYLWYFDIVVGASFSYHLISTWQEFGFHQQDIKSQTPFFSVSFILLANIIINPMVLLVVHQGWGAVPDYLREGFLWPYYFTFG